MHIWCVHPCVCGGAVGGWEEGESFGVRVCACARIPVHTQEGNTGLQQECETCRQERQIASASCQQGQGGEQLFLVLRP